MQADALVAVLAEDHRLAVLEHEHPVLANVALGEVAVRAVVEDVAVLENLDEDRAVVPAGALERLLEVLGVGVDRPGDEGRLGGQCDRQRLDRRSRPCPSGDDFVFLPSSEVGEAWPLVSP